MLILLPPSEGKTGAKRGKPLDLDSLGNASLNPHRHSVLDALVALCQDDEEQARKTLDLPPGLAAEVSRNAKLHSAPSAAAIKVYTGVLYDALGFDTLSPVAKRRAASRLLITSALFGVLRPSDRIPAYRLSGNVTLPGLGTVASVWREPTSAVMRDVRGLVVDMRSGTYTAFWRPEREQQSRVVSVRVLQEVDGKRSVVSHFNKATKGRIVRQLLEDGADPRTPARFADTLARLGWKVEPTPGKHFSYDVVVSEV